MKAVRYTRNASRVLARVPPPVARRIDERLRQYTDEPDALANNVKRLKGEDGILRLRVGDWRILFVEDGSDLTVLAIGPRGGVYR